MILAATRGPSAALYGEPLAAFGATTGQDFPAVLGAHPLAETVRFGSLPFIRLVGSLRHTFPILIYVLILESFLMIRALEEGVKDARPFWRPQKRISLYRNTRCPRDLWIEVVSQPPSAKLRDLASAATAVWLERLAIEAYDSPQWNRKA